MSVRTGIKHVDWEVQGACPWQAGWAQRVPCHWCRLKCKFDNLNKTLVAKERINMCTRTGIKNVYWGTRGLPLARHDRVKRVLWYKCRSKYNIDDSDERSTPELSVYQDWDKTCAPELGLKMSSRTGIKHVYGAFPWQPGRAQRVPWHRCKLKYNLDNLNKT